MKHKLFFSVVLGLLLVAWGTGCGVQPTGVAPPEEPKPAQPKSAETPVETRLPTPSTVFRGEEATMTPTVSPEANEVTPPPAAEAVVQLAREDLAGRLGRAPDAIWLVSVQAVEWRDTSLGCPQPGMMYAQVITPGFLVVLEAAGKQHEYHTDMGRFVVLCEK